LFVAFASQGTVLQIFVLRDFYREVLRSAITLALVRTDGRFFLLPQGFPTASHHALRPLLPRRHHLVPHAFKRWFERFCSRPASFPNFGRVRRTRHRVGSVSSVVESRFSYVSVIDFWFLLV